jgi:hypothetical protein
MSGNIAELLPRIGKRDTEEPEFDVDDVRRAREDLWRRIPKAYRVKPSESATWFKPASKPILDAAMAWDWSSPCLLICAPTDYGKSVAAAIVAIRLMRRGREADWKRWRGIRWVGIPELMTAARSWPLGSGECPEVRVASTCELAILDDLGNETDHASTLFDVTQSRYQRGLKTITTTGLAPRALVARYGECILRRLIQRDGKLGTIIDLTSKVKP